MANFLKKLTSKENKNKKQIENIIVLIVICIITLIIINKIWKGDVQSKKEERSTNTLQNGILASENQENATQTELETKLEKILSTIKNVGKVNVLINYSESSSLVPLYNESTTTSSTEEGDSTGGTRNITETETQKDVVFSENSGTKEPVTQKTLMPTIQGAIDVNVRTNIINAVGAVTGLSIDKIQVFEIQK